MSKASIWNKYRHLNTSQWPGSLSGEKRDQLAADLRDMCADYEIPFIVDDDVELAIKTRADGVHVGQKDERVGKVIDQVGGTMFVGLSCDTKEQIDIANQTAGFNPAPTEPTLVS